MDNIMDNIVDEPDNDDALPAWGKIHCCECMRPISYFTPGTVDRDANLELYCYSCADSIDKETH